MASSANSELRSGAFGPFELVEEIASGGMGVVYRARDRGGDEVALKLIAFEDRHRQSAFHAEVKALSLLQHPGIVRIVDHGVVENVGWYAMDLIEGVSLAEAGQPGRQVTVEEPTWTASSTDVPVDALPVPASPGEEGRGLAVEVALQAIAGLCRPLGYMHARGLVHRDLKPGNIVLRPDGSVVLIDFGLACESPGAHGRESLESASGPFQGTLAYMSPEQCRGARVDARADIYSLGCILYELLTGRPPFQGRSRSELVEQHLHAVALPPSLLVPTIPRRLDGLMARLIAKHPRDRLGYADEVQAVLLEVLGLPSTRTDAPATGEPPPCLYGSDFVDRDEPLSRMDDYLERLCEGRGGRVIVTGETGVGKTFFLSEVARRARQRRIRMIPAAATPPLRSDGSTVAEQRDPSPLGVFRPLLRACVDLLQSGEHPALLEVASHHANVLSAVEPAFRSLSRMPEEPAVSPEAARTRIIGAVRAVVVALCREGPVLLALDDLQWADDASTRIMCSLESEGPELALLIVGTMRTDDLAASHSTSELVASSAEVLPLGLLSTAHIGMVVAAMLGRAASGDTIEGLVARASGGNPYFASQYLHAAVGEGLLERRAGRWCLSERGATELAAADEPPTPANLREVAERRLSGLSAPALSLLQTLAAFGRECELQALVDAAGLDRTITLLLLGELEARAILAPQVDGTVRIAHGSVRDCAYGSMSAEATSAAHAAAARSLRGLDQGRYQFVLGRHSLLAGDSAAALSDFAAAGGKALAAGFIGEACHQLHQACQLIDETPSLIESDAERATLWRSYGEALAGLGHMEDAEGALRVALRTLGVPAPRTALPWMAVLVRELTRQILLRGAGWLFPAIGEPERAAQAEAARANTWLGFRYMFTTNSLGMMGSLVRAANQAERASALQLTVVPLTFLARIVGLVGLETAAGRYFALARNRARESLDVTTILRCDQSEAFYLYNSGGLDRALEVLESGIAMSRDSSVDYERSALELVRVFVQIAKGDFREAERLSLEVATSSARLGNAFHENQARKLLTICVLQTGRLEEAARMAGPLAAEAARRGNEIDRLNLEGVGCVAAYRGGDLEVTRRAALELAAAAEKSSQLFHLFELHTFLPEILVGCAVRELREGRRDGALIAAAERACRSARKCARVFKVLAPTALRLAATLNVALGRRGRAVALLREGGRLAGRFSMPLDRALISLEMVRIGHPDVQDRPGAASEACETLGRLGCAWHLRAAQQLGE